LHGKLSFKTLLQNNNNPIDYLVCRLDGRYAYQAREYHFPAAALAQILDRILPDKILVPAKQANVRIRLRSRNSTVSEIVKSGFILKG
jgi:hypothetical protein